MQFLKGRVIYVLPSSVLHLQIENQKVCEVENIFVSLVQIYLVAKHDLNWCEAINILFLTFLE